jgi:hypothetical protein
VATVGKRGTEAKIKEGIHHRDTENTEKSRRGVEEQWSSRTNLLDYSPAPRLHFLFLLGALCVLCGEN